MVGIPTNGRYTDLSGSPDTHSPLAQVKEQGDLVRQLKADKAAKAVIDEAVTKLKALKLEAEKAADKPEEIVKAETCDEDDVTPWDVKASSDKGIDYDKLIAKFGLSPIDPALLERLERVTGKKPHHFLRFGFV